MNILEKVKSNYQKVIEYHRRTKYDTRLDEMIWANNMRDIKDIVDTSRSPEDLIDKIDQTFMYAINFPPENGMNTGVWKSPYDQPHIREKQINWLLSKLKFSLESLPKHVQESKFIHHRNKTQRDRLLSGNFLRTLSISQEVFKHIGSVKNILELGAGCGHQARTFMIQQDCKYTIVDLPETLYFSFTYLSLCFPEKKILYVTCPEEMSEIDNYDIVFIPAVFADLLHGREYDLFINTASMGEMKNEVIHYWMDLIQNKLTIKNLFTLNRFLNVIHPSMTDRMNCNQCSTSYDKKWEIIDWELEPIYCRCPYIDTLHSRYVQIVARRPIERSEKELVTQSQLMLQDALDEDWKRLNGYYGNGVMQQRLNVLVNDMTMSGTLYKLWESIRLNCNKNNLSAMVEYLDRITIDFAFEEKYYYESCLNAQ